MSEGGSSECSSAMNSHENNEKVGPEIRVLTQKEVDAGIKSFIAPLTRQQEDLTRLVQGVATASHPTYFLRADTNAS